MFDHDSVLGGLNLLAEQNKPYRALRGDRPPYPVINENPSLFKVAENLNAADFGIFAGSYLLGIPLANRIASKSANSYGSKIVVFGLAHGYIYMMGGVLAMANSQLRLRGMVSNGLNWKY
jgi:NADH-ubiquinone oxidoreductase complex I, 21 kDa subunit